MPTIHICTFYIGRRYRVTFRNGRSQRTIEGKYLGLNSFHHTHEFDLRPEFGTTGIKPTDILGYEEI